MGCPAREQGEICSQASGLWKSGENMKMGEKCKGEREVRVGGGGGAGGAVPQSSRGNQCGARGRATAPQQGRPPRRRDSACMGRSFRPLVPSSLSLGRAHRGSPSPDPAPHQLRFWGLPIGTAFLCWEEPCRQNQRPPSSESLGLLTGRDHYHVLGTCHLHSRPAGTAGRGHRTVGYQAQPPILQSALPSERLSESRGRAHSEDPHGCRGSSPRRVLPRVPRVVLWERGPGWPHTGAGG